MTRCLHLPPLGYLLVSTDLHGSLGDYLRLESLFLRLSRGCPPEAPLRWLQLGDLVHGPDDVSRKRMPARFGDPDDSPELIRRYAALRRRWPDRVHFVLGNHDHAHIGGLPCRKFHHDEAAFLEDRLSGEGRADLRWLLDNALLAARTSGGLLLCHAHPDDTAWSWEELDVPLPPRTQRQRRILEGLLWHRGHPAEVRARLLAQVGCTMLIHGHESDTGGIFSEGPDHLCPVIFGAFQHEKRYLLLRLDQPYDAVSALREGEQIWRLHGAEPEGLP